MDYCTAGPQYASGGFIADSQTGRRHQRVAAAVPRPGQQHRRLVERRLEPGVRRRRGAPPQSSSPEPAATRPWPPPGHAARSRSSTSTRRAVQRVRARPAARLGRHDLGERADGGHVDPDLATSSSPSPTDSAQTINAALADGQEPDAHPRASTTSTGASRSSAPTPSCSASARRRSCRDNGAAADDGRRRPRA